MQEVQTTLPTGSILRDRYVIESLLGIGGFGIVYRVSDLRVPGNQYALKEVFQPRRKDQNVKEKNRFIFESDVLRRLDHRALPRVYRVFEDEEHGRAYMLMDFIDGPNLEILRKHLPEKRFTLPQVMTILVPIVDAISYLHRQSPPIIHRDIKPSNIIVPTPHTAMLVDFDIAKEFDPDSTTTALRRCSPGYGAPEQYGHGTSTLTDIYGLGATIYALLTGVVPPDALQRMTMVNARGNDPLVPINQLVPNIPKNVVESVQRAMSLHSNDRYASIGHFWQTFDSYATAHELPAAFVARSTWSQAFAVSKGMSQITTAIDRQKLSPTPVSALPITPPISRQPKKNLSMTPSSPLPLTPSPTTQPPITQRKKRRRFAIVLFFLALFVASSSTAGLWFLFGQHQIALSVIPTLAPYGTTGTANAPAADPTGMSTSVVISRKVNTNLTPTLPAPSASPTSAPPTASPTQRPTPRPSPTPTPSPTPNPYPLLARTYHGTIVDTTPTPNITTGMSLSSISQNKENISGYFTVNAPLQGNGPFTGTVGSNKYIQFTVKGYNGDSPLYFWGFVQQDASLQGQYCSLDQSGHCSANAGASGYWSVTPS